MERAKRARAPARARVTTLCRLIQEEIAAPAPNKETLQALLAKLLDAQKRLKDCDAVVLNTMLDEVTDDSAIQLEDDQAEEYQDSIRDAIRTIETATRVPVSKGDEDGGKAARTFKLPKVELRKFSGELKDWLGWWAQFRKIHEDKVLHASDKFQYLVQSMSPGSRAAELVGSYPMSEENYPLVIAALQERFGKTELLQEVYVRELLKMVTTNAANPKGNVKLSSMYDKLEAQLRALSSLGISGSNMSVFLHPMIESSLPEHLLVAWQRSPNYGKDGSEENPPKSKYDYLMEFLRSEVENEAKRSLVSSFDSSSQKKPVADKVRCLSPKRKGTPTAASLHAGSAKGKKNASLCVFCDKSHRSEDCWAARDMSYEDKQRKVRDAKACYKCLVKGHFAAQCKTPSQCCKYQGFHPTVLCRPPGKVEVSQFAAEDPQPKFEGMPSVSNYHEVNRKCVLLKTLHVRARGQNGEVREVRLLFDDGSQQSFIKTSLAATLNCRKIGQTEFRSSLFGGVISGMKRKTAFIVNLKGMTGDNQQDLQFYNEDVICASCPTVPFGPWIRELTKKKIYLTDGYADSPEVDILIGSDLWGKLMTGRIRKLQNGLIAMESVFGWTLSGELPMNIEESPCAANTVIALLGLKDKPLSDLWDLETIGIQDCAITVKKEEHDAEVKAALQANLVREGDGRYVVPLLFKSRDIPLPSNKEVALKRLVNATKKLKREELYETYGKMFEDWEKEGIIKLSCEDPSVKEHYLPHHPVLKPESLTTPVRPVFDGSCRVGSAPSLNMCLEPGPNMLELILRVLLRFRQDAIGVTCDIRKAYQRIAVKEKDRNLQKFLWWEDSDKGILKVYRHARVVFGLNCSAFILAAVLEHHLDHVLPEEKEIAEKLKRCLYVDNAACSFSTAEEFYEFKEKSTKMMAEAKMELRQWETNLDFIGETKVTNVLGLKWNMEEDVLFCKVPKKWNPDLGSIRSRSVLAAVAGVFDPIGFLCPVLLAPKLMLQESWARQSGWDEEWGAADKKKFLKWYGQLVNVEDVKVPRNAFGSSFVPSRTQIHVFVDASQSAYAAAIFARVEDEDGVIVQLLVAKAKVAPLVKKKGVTEKMTIPRLEVLACQIGARLLDYLRKSLPVSDCETHLWSDSMTAIAWIARDEDWGTWVGNRVREIRKLTQEARWRHVPGTLNPADLPSRGCSVQDLARSQWWEGPTWLKEEANYWPSSQPEVNEEEVSSELRKTAVTAIVVEVPEPTFSSYLSNVAVRGWVRRFVENLKRKIRKLPLNRKRYLSIEELRVGVMDLMKEIQQRHFPVKPIIRNLGIFEKDGLICVKTRLAYRKDPALFKSPVLLPSKDPFVSQLIQFVHECHGHAGIQIVLGEIRQKFWIIHGRKAVRQVIQKCVVCRRHAAKSFDVVPANLPEARVKTSFAFETTGVDLAGPLHLKSGKKVWVVVFTCAVYRGIYLDLVESLSAQDFLDSLEKFCFLIGRPSRIYSDQGTNFVAAQSLMKKLNWKKLEPLFQVKQIEWNLNPASAPWWGGFWERMVKSVKDLLWRMLGTARLTMKEMSKCLAAITHTINSRPLTTLTEDSDDLMPLTPEMFMKDLPITELPERELITSRDLQRAHKKLNELKNALKERFRKEYLANLVQRKNEKSCPVPKIGDVVLVGSDNKRRYEWPLGRIMELSPGNRRAKVRTQRGILDRPLQRLYPLEIPGASEIPVGIMKKAKRFVTKTPEVGEDVIIKTRRGREIKKVQRYGTWNH